MSKMADKMKDSHKPKTDEYFKRIKGSQLLELIEDEDVEVRRSPGLDLWCTNHHTSLVEARRRPHGG